LALGRSGEAGVEEWREISRDARPGSQAGLAASQIGMLDLAGPKPDDGIPTILSFLHNSIMYQGFGPPKHSFSVSQKEGSPGGD
jgi:hypothetical protein